MTGLPKDTIQYPMKLERVIHFPDPRMFPHKGGIQESHLLGWWNASSLTLINFFPLKSIKNSWQNWAFFLLRVFVDSIFLSGWVFRISNFSNISCDRQGWNFRFVSRSRYQAIRWTRSCRALKHPDTANSTTSPPGEKQEVDLFIPTNRSPISKKKAIHPSICRM